MQLKVVLLVVIIIALIIAVIVQSYTNNYVELPVIKSESLSTLLLVQVLFRHGDRTLEGWFNYPNDPHINHSYFPNHLGNINKQGRLKSYNLGKELKTRYGKFLGEDYYRGIVQSFSSNYDRTQLTLQCVHAGLFSEQGPIRDLPWRPISYNIFETEEDKYLGLMKHCKTMRTHFSLPKDTETQKAVAYVEEHSGMPLEDMHNFVALTDVFKIQVANNIKLPEWTKTVFPQPMSSIYNLAWQMFAQDSIRLGSGGLINLITRNARKKANHNVESFGRKIILYSGHDYNLAFLLNAINAWDGITAEFCSYVAVELHNIDGVYGFKVFYQNRRDAEIRQLKIPFCGSTFCPLDVFVQNTQWLYDPDPMCPMFLV